MAQVPEKALQVLIIDDDPSYQKLVEMRLKSIFPDLVVTSFARVNEARETLKELKALPFDLVVCDQHLPDGKGTDLIAEGAFRDLAVLCVSSDESPDLAGKTLKAGAAYFLSKQEISTPLFKPLVLGILDRNRLQRQLAKAQIDKAVIDSVKTLVATLRHEINNPLGAVLGAAFLLKKENSASPELKEAAELVESSGQRIKHVLNELCQAIELDSVSKANQRVFHIPGDKPWEED